jgi:DNA-binding protein YbaB
MGQPSQVGEGAMTDEILRRLQRLQEQATGDDQVPDGLRRLYAEAVQFTQRMAAPHVLQTPYVGTGAAGMVSVSVGPDGRVSDVSVDPDWSSGLTVEELGSAVVEAVSDAALNRLADWADATDGPAVRTAGVAIGAGRRPSESVQPPLPWIPPPEPLGALSNADVEANVGVLFELMADARAAIDAAGRRLEERATARASGRNPGREVTITLQGDMPVVVEFSPAWARRAAASEIGHALRLAFAAAYRAQGSLTVDDLAAGSPLAALRELTADPLALLRRVGLRPDTESDEGETRATTH